MNKLLIDAGNSSIKWAFLDTLLDTKPLSKIQSRPYENNTPSETFKAVLEQQQKEYEIDEVIIVSVLGDSYINAIKQISQDAELQFLNIPPSAELAGITSAYNEPHKLGTDRLVAMIAAYHLEKSQASIVVDSGTATTIDAVDAQGQHLGGLILPGMDLCSQSLLDNTELLEAFNESKREFEPNIFSTDTKQAIASGSLFGLAGAINNICLKMESEILKKSSDNIVVKKLICGGSASKLLPYLSKEFKHHDDLLMQGLEIISKHNKNTK